MPNDFGFDFRSTTAPAGITDPSYATVETDNNNANAVNYAANRATVNGVLIGFGWELISGNSVTARDRGTSATDARIYGMNFAANSAGTSTWRLDLPALGDWDIALAIGDGVGNNAQNNHVKLNDTNSLLVDFSKNTGSNQFADAGGNLRTAAAWVSTGAAVTVRVTFTTLIARVVLGGTVDSNSSCLAFIRFTQATPSFIPRLPIMKAG